MIDADALLDAFAAENDAKECQWTLYGIKRKIEDAPRQEPCEDAISRQAYIERYRKWGYSEYGRKMNNEALAIRVAMSLPPVTPQPKMGHWIINEDEENTVHGHCSVCGWEAHYYEDDIIGMPYCPNCGAKMTEPQESENKE
jgi:hypothetical protein